MESLRELNIGRWWPLPVAAAILVVGGAALLYTGTGSDGSEDGGLAAGPGPLPGAEEADPGETSADSGDTGVAAAEPATVAVSVDGAGAGDGTAGDAGAGTTASTDPTGSSSSAPGSESSTTSSGTASTSTATSQRSSSTGRGGSSTTGGGSTSTVASSSSTPSSVTSTTSSPTSATTRPATTTTRRATTAPPTTVVGPSGGGYRNCRAPAGGDVTSIDFAAERAAGRSVFDLNQGSLGGNRTFVRAVFELGSDRMSWGSEGVELRIDMADPAATNNRYRAELRETTIDQPIPVGTTQAYCMRFRVNELPDMYGPVKIFQRFNRDLDGPDIGVELTGANQFSNAVPNDLQVVAWDGRHRIGRQLEAVNTLMVVVHNHPTNGSYKVMLNGSVLRARSGINTVGASAGGWSQFGLYPHGLYDDDGPNRQNQIDSGRTVVRFEYRDFTITDYRSGPSDLGPFTVG